MLCTCGHDSDDHGGADASVTHTHVAGRCSKCSCEAFTVPGSMRAMYTRVCGACGYEWKAPSATGACPRCHDENTKTTRLQNNGLKRI